MDTYNIKVELQITARNQGEAFNQVEARLKDHGCGRAVPDPWEMWIKKVTVSAKSPLPPPKERG